MVMLSIVHTFPPSLELKPEYVAPAAEAIVLPKVVSAEARVIFVLRYFCSATVPVQPPSHSVPVPYLLDQHYSRKFGNKNSPSHIRPRLVREGRENLARLRIGLLIIQQSILDANLIRPAHWAGVPIQLSKAAEQTSPYTPLACCCTAPGIAGPAFQRGLDKIAGAVAHPGPEEELAALSCRRRTGDEGGDGVDDGGFGRTERDAAAPGVFPFDDGGRYAQGREKEAENEFHWDIDEESQLLSAELFVSG
ncbi:hypothetical protein ACP6JB_006156 [Aspergillus fumigatus]